MRIGIDCRLWSQTGVGRYTRNLVINLSTLDKRNDYRLFVRKEDVGEVKIQNSKFKIVSVNVPWHSFKEQIIFPKALSRENLDLMHFTYFSVPTLYRRPYVLTVHDLTLNHFKSGKASTRNFAIYNLKRNAYLYVIRMAIKNAKKIIAVSKATRHELVDHMNTPQDKIAVIYEGVDESLSGLGKSSISDPYILYVGNVYPHKNVEQMVLAFFKAKKPSNGRLVFVGKEDYFYKKLREKVGKLDKKNQIMFLGFVEDEKLSALYRNAEALIMPSFMEGFGLPVLEAMANKCLVLSSNIPSLKEIAGDSAIYFDPSSISDIASKIEFAFSNSTREGYIEKGFKRSKEFSWERMARETLKIYENSFSLRSGQ